mmetsp:Transcript_16328/g.32982  ORF Transcript_16328/g.32982 Transcript_16328/m.32982 type:complete len:178 (-) Transcript_16328:237-770(-)
MLGSLQNSAHKLVSRLMSGRRGKRRVSFGSTATVFEFERMVFGGGGVPDDDATALGLGPKLENMSEVPLQEKDGKDEYGCSGCLAASERAELLAQFASPKALQKELDAHISPLVERTQRERAETAVSAEEQRYMPSSTEDAVNLAMQDAEVARKYLAPRKSTGVKLSSIIRKKKSRS